MGLAVEGRSLVGRQGQAGQHAPEIGVDVRLLAAVGDHHIGRLDGDGLHQHVQHVGHAQFAGAQVEVYSTGGGIGPRAERVIAIGDQDFAAVPGGGQRRENFRVDQARSEHEGILCVKGRAGGPPAA